MGAALGSGNGQTGVDEAVDGQIIVSAQGVEFDAVADFAFSVSSWSALA